MTDIVKTDTPRRLLLVHAHPDDETLTTGGTIARYAAEGAEVTVVTCTLGEEGEVIGDTWAGLVADAADQLGGYRILELTTALARLGAAGPCFLGGAGRWRDSGMVGTAAAANPRAFVNADLGEVVAALVDVIRDRRPHVVICYDPVGGYGHPDHIRVHEAVTAAVESAGAAGCSAAGQPWEVAKLYWTVTEETSLTEGLGCITEFPAHWRLPDPGELPSVPDEQVTTTIDVRAHLAAKVAGFEAHATQVTVSPSGTEYALSNNVVQPILLDEHYVLVRGTLGEVAADGRERDLFAGV
ncbi:N-acetyl-1-D-myo-inositol-2-amino-2-deoxy-alpha-D-glucopyranoside deacetylase [Rhodococcus sp. NPDC003318]|uniref:N-acetyl-1-D-myo-inositol-2-amino-2-deoxy-alpha- D-glucopyranoside deacetylase n=1 Tax=Rhodococcus sp. NPDC003318 TaxID=3364503 RepID=UPI003684A811